MKQPHTREVELRRNVGVAPEPWDTSTELLRALSRVQWRQWFEERRTENAQRDGPWIVEHWIGGNTFRAFHHMPKPSSQVFRARPVSAPGPPLCISSDLLAQECTFAPSAADAKFLDKQLIVTGRVLTPAQGPGRYLDLDTEPYMVRCYGPDIETLEKGQDVTLQCFWGGKPGAIVLGGCRKVSPDTTCSPFVSSEFGTKDGNIELTLQPRIEGHYVIVSGTTNLRDGALIGYEVSHPPTTDEIENPPARPEIFAVFKDTKVRSGEYFAKTDISRWPRGEIEIRATFDTFPRSQPAWVKAEFGEMGRNLRGSAVVAAGKGYKVAEVRRFVSKR